MICVVLAAGYATRLYPLTKNFPKPLLDVNEKTVLDWLLEDIDGIDEITEYVIISNHKFYDHFEKWSKNNKLTKKIRVVDDGSIDNNTRLGAVKDIAFAVDKLKIDDDLMVLAGDNVLEFSLRHFYDFYKEKNATSVMRYWVEDKSTLSKYGIATVDEDSKILNFKEKPQNPDSNWAVPPFYIYKREDVPMINKAINNGSETDAPGSFIEWLCTQTTVYAYSMPGKRFDIGNVQSYEQVKKDFKGIVI